MSKMEIFMTVLTVLGCIYTTFFAVKVDRFLTKKSQNEDESFLARKAYQIVAHINRSIVKGVKEDLADGHISETEYRHRLAGAFDTAVTAVKEVGADICNTKAEHLVNTAVLEQKRLDDPKMKRAMKNSLKQPQV